MSDRKESYSSVAGNAPGNRSGDNKDSASESGGLVGTKPPALGSVGKDATGALGDKGEGFGLGGEDVKGSLKIHIKLDLDADIRIIAKVKGDIAIGLL